MPRIDRRRARGAALTAALTGGALLLAVLAPGTSGAFTASVTNSSDTAATKATFTCADKFEARKATAFFEYSLQDATTSQTAADSSSASNPGTYRSGTSVTTKGSGSAANEACKNDTSGVPWNLSADSVVSTAKSWTVGGTGSYPDFTLQVWLKLSATDNGKIAGLETDQTGTASTNYGKRLSLSSSTVYYCLANDTSKCLAASSTLTTGTWYLITATTSSSGSYLYINATQVASSTTYTSTNVGATTGYWRLGQGRSTLGAADAVKGSMRFAAAYTVALTADQVKSDYAIGAP